MPYGLIHNPDKSYSVINTETRKVHAKHTTKDKAKAQIRLLQALEHGFVSSQQSSSTK
jgi:hypothetical protein